MDVWGLGCLLHELINLAPPFLGDNLEDLKQKILNDDPPEIPPTYDYSISQLYKKMMSKNPNLRPSCEDILENPTLKAFIKKNKFLNDHKTSQNRF